MLKKHSLAIILAIIVGLIFSIFNLYLIINTPDGYVFTPFNGGDTNLYAAQTKQIVLGRLTDCDPFISENKKNISILPMIPPIIFSVLTKITGSLKNSFILGNFIFPAIDFISIYFFIYLLTKKRHVAILGSLSTIFLYPLTTSFPPVTKSILDSFINKLFLRGETFFGFHRLMPIQFTFAPFIMYFVFLQNFLNTKKTVNAIFAGIFSGLLAYIYFYHWAVSLGVSFLVLLFALINKEKKVIKSLVLLSLIAIILSLPYLYRAMLTSISAYSAGFGLLHGRIIEPLITLRYLAVLLIFIFMQKKEIIKKNTVLLSIIIISILAMNIQLVFGFNLSPGHWPYTTLEPLLVIVGVVFINNTLRIAKYIAYFLICLILGFGILGQIKTTQSNLQNFYLNKNQADLINYLKNNGNNKYVVGSLDNLLIRQLPVLTDKYNFLPYYYSCLNNSQLWERVLILAKLQNLSIEELKYLMTDTQFFGAIFNLYYNYDRSSKIDGLIFPDIIKHKILTSNPILTFGARYIPDNIKETKISEYNDLNNSKLNSLLCNYKLNYLILNSKTYNQKKINDDFLVLSYSNKDYLVYKIENLRCNND